MPKKAKSPQTLYFECFFAKKLSHLIESRRPRYRNLEPNYAGLGRIHHGCLREFLDLKIKDGVIGLPIYRAIHPKPKKGTDHHLDNQSPLADTRDKFRLRCAKSMGWGFINETLRNYRQVNNPARQGLVNHRKRVLRSRQR